MAYRKTSNISRTLVGNKIVDNSDVVGASPVGAAPTTSSFSTEHLASMDWAKTTARGYKKHLSLGIWCDLHQRFYGSTIVRCSNTIRCQTINSHSELKLKNPLGNCSKNRTKYNVSMSSAIHWSIRNIAAPAVCTMKTNKTTNEQKQFSQKTSKKHEVYICHIHNTCQLLTYIINPPDVDKDFGLFQGN